MNWPFVLFILLLLLSGLLFFKWLKSIFKAMLLTALLAFLVMTLIALFTFMDLRTIEQGKILLLVEEDGTFVRGAEVVLISTDPEQDVDEAFLWGLNEGDEDTLTSSLTLYKRIIVFKDLHVEKNESISDALGESVREHGALSLISGIRAKTIDVYPRTFAITVIDSLPGKKVSDP